MQIPSWTTHEALEHNQYIYDILLQSIKATYEELKQQTQCSYKLWHRFQVTYKELKRISITRKPPRAVRFQTTYEELKREMFHLDLLLVYRF